MNKNKNYKKDGIEALSKRRTDVLMGASQSSKSFFKNYFFIFLFLIFSLPFISSASNTIYKDCSYGNCPTKQITTISNASGGTIYINQTTNSTDTLQDVTDRGATTTNDIIVNGINDTNGGKSIDPNLRYFYDKLGYIAINYSDAYAIQLNPDVYYNGFLVVDNNGIVAVDTSAYITNPLSADINANHFNIYNIGEIDDSVPVISIDSNNRVLKDSSGSSILDWSGTFNPATAISFAGFNPYRVLIGNAIDEAGINLNVNGTIQGEGLYLYNGGTRGHLTYSDYLSKFVMDNDLEVQGDISANNICYTNGTGCPVVTGGNESFNQTLTDSLYYSITNPAGYYNITTLPASSTNLTGYAMLNGTNQPFTGNIQVNKATPQYSLNDSNDNQISRWYRTNNSAEMVLANKILVLASSLTLIPNMTSNTAPSGTASAKTNPTQAWYAFNNDANTGQRWISDNNDIPSWIQYQFPTATIINRYAVGSSSGVGDGTVRNPTSFNFSGSNDGSSWTVLDNRTGVTWTEGEKKTYNFVNTNAYAYYRLDMFSSASSFVEVAQLDMINSADSFNEINLIDSKNSGIVGIAGNNTFGALAGYNFFGTSTGNTYLNGLQLIFQTAGLTRFSTNTAGNLIFPNSFLTYFGTASSSSISYNGTDMLINPKDVGSGNAYILGDLRTTGNLVTQNISSGSILQKNAANETIIIQTQNSGASKVTGNNNVIIGGLAGNKSTTATDMVLIGYKAGQSPTTAQTRSVVIGSSAGGNAVTGGASDNVYIGSNAGLGIRGSQQGVIIGSQAAATGTGYPQYITLVGYGAGYKIDTGADYVTAMGMNSLALLTTGGKNTAIGYGSGGAVTTNTENTFLGYNAGSSWTGAYNTVVGSSAGVGVNSVGQQNVGLGYGVYTAGTMSGSFNTAIGTMAGYSQTSGASSIFLGNKAGYRSNVVNTLIIDNQDRSSASGEYNNSLIYGIFNASRDYQHINLNANVNISGNEIISGNLIVQGNLSVKRPYGMFSSTETQSVAAPATPYSMTFNWTEDSYLINKASDNSNFTFLQTGDYLIELSIIAQGGQGDRAEIWVQKNGVNVPRSNTIYDFKGTNANAVIAVPFIIDMNTTDVFRVMYAGSSTNVKLQYTTNTSYSPETPSAIMTISKNSEIT